MFPAINMVPGIFYKTCIDQTHTFWKLENVTVEHLRTETSDKSNLKLDINA